MKTKDEHEPTPVMVKREMLVRCMNTCRILRNNLAEAQLKLCPKFRECGAKEGEGCTCFPPDGPYANSVPPNTAVGMKIETGYCLRKKSLT